MKTSTNLQTSVNGKKDGYGIFSIRNGKTPRRISRTLFSLTSVTSVVKSFMAIYDAR